MSDRKNNKKQKISEIEPISNNFSKNKSPKDKTKAPEPGRPEQKAQDKGFIQEWF